VITLGVIWWADNEYDLDTSRTMGLTAFSIANLAFSLTARSELRSVFSLDTFDDRRFLITTGMSAAAIVLATEFGLFQKILATTSMDLGQWLICLVAGAFVIVPTEIRKMFLRRRR
jgi:Ca2+-transporting ATPase